MSFSWKENLPKELSDKVTKVESMIQPRLEEIDEQVLYNQQRVLDLFRKHHVGEEDLVPSTGYGYDDIGRDKIEDIYADYFKTDDACLRIIIAAAIWNAGEKNRDDSPRKNRIYFRHHPKGS